MEGAASAASGAVPADRAPDRPAGSRGMWARLAPVSRAGAIALGLTAAQIGCGCALSGRTSPVEAYRALCQWDSGWYLHILVHGYVSPPIVTPENFGNVAFFPGYPTAVGFVARALRLDLQTALLVTAQCACWGFWTYLLLVLRRWRVSRGVRVLAMASLLAHPAAFFLVTGYSESLFLLALVGMVYWAQSERGKRSWPAAAGHGFVMTATRLVGAPLAIYPFCQWLAARRTPGHRAGHLTCGAAAVVTGLGAVSFLAYCQVRFGAWDLYMKTNEAGWGVHPHALGFLHPKAYTWPRRWPIFADGFVNPYAVSRLCLPVLLLALAALSITEWRLARRGAGDGWRARLGLYVGAVLMLYIISSASIGSTVRFALSVQVLITLAAAHLLAGVELRQLRQRRWILAAVVAGQLVCLVLQLGFAYRFTHGMWVA